MIKPMLLPGKRAKILAAIGVVVVCLLLPNKPAQADSGIRGYLWSATAGWISMNCSNGGTCATSDYGVEFGKPEEFIDPISGKTLKKSKINGFAWSTNMGWICFGEICDGVLDKFGQLLKNPENTDSNYAEWVESDGIYGRIYGWARLVNEGAAGWISLNCDNRNLKVCDPVAETGQYYYVGFNADEGAFCESGECDDPPAPDPAYPSHWSWSGNTGGTGIGWVDWSLAETDWAPSVIGSVLRPQGIFEPVQTGPPLPGIHPSDYTITVQSLYSPKDYMLRCDIIKPNGEKTYVGRVFTDNPRNGDNETLLGTVPALDSVQNADPGLDAIQNNKLWYIERCSLSLEADGTPCTSDIDCGAGLLCDAGVENAVDECHEIAVQTGKLPLYTHHNDWTLFNFDEDFYQAIKCYTQFEDEFFHNSSQCDFLGNATFSMAMNKGIPIERNCVDGLDNDGNSLTDCADPFCKNLAIDCIEHPALSCDWVEAPSNVGQCESIQYETGDICCTRQNKLVTGMECKFKSPNDGYYDCGCVEDEFGDLPTDLGPDCVLPGYTYGDLCCTASNQVIKAVAPAGP